MKRITKLENQLEKEKHLNYPFDTSTNARQNVDAQNVFTSPVRLNRDQEEELKKQRFNIRIYLEVKATKVHKVKKHKEKTFQLIQMTMIVI